MEITTAPEQPPAQIIDLFEALKRSLESQARPHAPAQPTKRRRRAKSRPAASRAPEKTEPAETREAESERSDEAASKRKRRTKTGSG